MNQKQNDPTRNEALISRRKKCNLKQWQVADAINISIRHYQNIEAGDCKPNVETAISIANLLGCEVTDLFGPRRNPEENDKGNFSTEMGKGAISVVTTTDDGGVKKEEDPTVAAAKLSEVTPSVMVAAAKDLQDGRADTEEGRRVLELMEAVGGAALR
jgi:DNA-binding XRE family transcriptional regulator